MICYSKSEKETHKIAGKLATKIMKGRSTRLVQLRSSQVRASVIALEGELGAGKTTFVKGFAKALGIKAKIKSPTFTLMKEYEVPSLKKSQNTNHKSQTNSPDFVSDKVGITKSRILDFSTKSERLGKNRDKFKISNSKHLVHIDCYRVRDHRDLATLDLKSLFKSPDNIVLIEWPERVIKILPKKLLRVHIDHIDKNKRKMTISNG